MKRSIAAALAGLVAVVLTAGRATTAVRTGDLHHHGGTIAILGDVVIAGHASGAGSFTGDGRITFGGAYSPGNSPAIVTIAPQIVFTPSNVLTMEIGGPTPGPGTPIDNGYDKLIFTSAATPQVTWGGTLVIELFNGFSPAVGSEFDLFDFDAARDAGTFSSIVIHDNGLLPANSVLDTSAIYTTGIVRVVSTLTPIEQWRQLHFGITTDSGDAANLFDFDRDGTVNLIEYALGMNPKIPGTTGLPVVGKVNVSGADYLTLTITRPIAATDVSYRFLAGSAPAATSEGSLYSPAGNVPTNAVTTEHSRITAGANEVITIRDNTP
jgi:hypothetical protein